MELTPAEQSILIDLLVNGADLPANVSERIDVSRVHVSNSLGMLADRGYVEPKGRGVHMLTKEGVRMARAIHREE